MGDAKVLGDVFYYDGVFGGLFGSLRFEHIDTALMNDHDGTRIMRMTRVHTDP